MVAQIGPLPLRRPYVASDTAWYLVAITAHRHLGVRVGVEADLHAGSAVSFSCQTEHATSLAS